MKQCRVTVASYTGFAAALADWDAMEARNADADLGLVDGAVVEGDADTVRVVHRHSRRTYAMGALATAVVGLLRPPAIITGAVAGGVGGNVLILLGQSLSRGDVLALGAVMDTGPISYVTLTEHPPALGWAGLLSGAGTRVTATSPVPMRALRQAFDRDALD